MEVAKKYTPLTMGEVIRILPLAFKTVTGVNISSALPYLLALLHLENASGSAIANHNWGNVIVNSDNEDYFYFPNNERHFKSNPNHDKGAQYFIRRLLSPTHKRMIIAALDDDFEAFVSGYYDINPDTHKAYNFIADGEYKELVKKNFKSLVDSYKETVATPNYVRPGSTIRPFPPAKSSSGALPILLAIVSGIGYLIWKKYK